MATPPFPFLTDHRPIQQGRYEKVAALRAAGINPYPARFEPSHLAAEVIAAEGELLDREDKPVALMGRAMTIRKFGKAAFFHLLDRSGQVQIYINAKAIDEAGFALYKEYLDAGDIVGVTGHLFRTKTGELTVQAKTLQLLTKSTRPLPEKWHGLTDKELRYRRRYVDLIVNPDVVATMRTRSKMVAAMRRWLDDQEFLEVETPMLQPMYGGASARPFSTHHNALDMPLYLRIAPELYLKRLVVGGMHRVYEINRNFRNEGISVRHNPEFTMLELYAGGWNAARLMDFVEELLIATVQLGTGAATIKTKGGDVPIGGRPWPRLSILDALQKFAGLALDWTMSLEQVKAAVAGKHALPAAANSAIDAIVFLFEELCEEHLVEPTFITQFPKAISPLAKSMDGNPDVTDRFELYANGMEIANGFSELNDPAEQYARFAEQVERRKGGDMEAVGVIDEDYVRALEYGMPPTAGLGVGIDRLVMLATGAESIRDVILFPLMRPVSPEVDANAEAEATDGQGPATP